MLLPLLGIWNSSWQVFGLFKARKRLLFLRFWWFIHEFSEIYTLLFLKICYNDSRFDAVLSEISANKWADFTKKSTFHRNKMPCWEDVLSQHGIFMVLILILQQKNDSLDLPFYFTLSFFCCFRNANSLLGKRSTAGCFCLIKPKKSRIFGFFPKRKHCTIVSFVQCGYGCGSQIWTDDLRVMRDLFHILDIL